MNKVSLILTTFNNQENLPKTLESIEMQDYPLIEIVIKDGGSKDDTISIIEKYKNKSHFEVKYTSCPDTGIYDAMNQGYAMSTGDVIAFFNDRFLVKDAVSKMMKAIYDEEDDGVKSLKNTDSHIVGAHADLVYANGDEVVRYWRMGPQKSIYTGWLPGHPTMYLKREIYEKYGLYNTGYRISADYEFMIRYLKDKENRLAYVPETLISMYYGGTSNSTLGSYIESLIEGHRALTSNGIHPAFIVDGIRTLRVLWQFVKR